MGGVIILGGVTIAEGTVIGVNAIVTKNVPVDAVAVGIPARII
jgi:acetyltransferase-like isoleucine patch superfamily enzyme